MVRVISVTITFFSSEVTFTEPAGENCPSRWGDYNGMRHDIKERKRARLERLACHSIFARISVSFFQHFVSRVNLRLLAIYLTMMEGNFPHQ